jgi:hypothetical protein
MATGRDLQLQLVADLVRDAQVQIDKALPPGSVVPQHTDGGHFYGTNGGSVYPSVTGVIGYIKDPSIQQFDKNEALRYVETHLHTVVDNGKIDYLKVIDLLHNAKNASRGVLMDAADIGTQIHDRRERYYQDWIDAGPLKRPDIASYYDLEKDDSRLISAMRALGKFCDEQEYIPVRTEVMVYSDRYQIAGMLDDIGYVNSFIRKGDKNCQHNLWIDGLTTRCDKCSYKRQWQFVLSDLKSSNQFKDSYYYQVALYHLMFVDLVGRKPKRSFILKTSKTDGNYKLEELTNMAQLVAGAKRILAAARAVEKVKELRSGANKKKVIKI